MIPPGSDDRRANLREAFPGAVCDSGEKDELAEVAGVPLRDLDDDQLDIVALRLVTESDDEPVLTRIGRIVDEVWNAEVAAERAVERERESRTGIYLVPPPEVDPQTTREPETQVPPG